MNKSVLNGQKGFTLIELLAVMAIIGILAAVVLTSTSGTQDSGDIVPRIFRKTGRAGALGQGHRSAAILAFGAGVGGLYGSAGLANRRDPSWDNRT